MDDASLKNLDELPSSNNDVFDMDLSFMTVPDISETGSGSDIASTPGRKAHHVPDARILDAPLITPSSTPTKTIPIGDETPSPEKKEDQIKTVYEKVKYRDDIGKLVLTKERITFAPYDGGSPTRGSLVALDDGDEPHPHHHSWRWKAIKKHQISPASTGANKLRLVSTENDKKAVTFIMANREELERIRQDITQRLKPVKKGRRQQRSKSPKSRNAATTGTTTTTTTNNNNTDETTPLVSTMTSIRNYSNNNNDNHDEELGVEQGRTSIRNYNLDKELASTTTGGGGRSHKAVWIGACIIVLVLIGMKIYQMKMVQSTTTIPAPPPLPATPSDVSINTRTTSTTPPTTKSMWITNDD